MATLEAIKSQGIRLFERDTSHEPLGRQRELVKFEESFDVIRELPITLGRKILLAALLNLGNAKMFGNNIGLNYGYFLKNPYDPRITKRVIDEMAFEIDGQADMFAAPDDSDIFTGLQLATALNVPFLRVRKNLPSNGKDVYEAAIESYTRPGQYDVFSIEKGVIRPYLFGTEGRIAIGSDIIDTGEMTLLHQYLAEQMRSEDHQRANVLVGAALFEKKYTGAAKRLSNANIISISGIQIEDIGFKNGKPDDQKGWITIPQGPDYSFAFNTDPIPTPLLLEALS